MPSRPSWCWPGSLTRGIAGVCATSLQGSWAWPCALVAGARSFTAIADWAADADDQILHGLGVNGAVPSEFTFRRTLQRPGTDGFDGRRVIAVDGKTLRSPASGGEPGDHLLATLDHAYGAVLGQVEVGAKTNEIPMFPVLLDRIDITGAVLTADALHAQRGHATYLAARGAHYVLTVKRNQPGLFAQLAALPWRQVPVAHDSRERGHGRYEHRVIKVTAVAAGLAFPHAAQAIQIVRRRKLPGKKKWSPETLYAIISLAATQASPAGLAAIIRGHWVIEDRLHWVRDMDYDEDCFQVRTASGPRIMAALRNLAVTILRLAGHASIAAALRYHVRRPDWPLRTIMNC